MERIIVRTAKPEDRIRAVFVEGQAIPGLHYLDKVYDEWLSDKEGKLLVAEMDGELVGVGKFSVLPDRSAWLETLRVLPSCQGFGVGKEFYRKFLQLAEERNIKNLRMYTGTDNYASKGLAELYGFKLICTFRGSAFEVPKEVDNTAAEGFLPVTDPKRAIKLLAPCEKTWSDFSIMNRTFYKASPALWEDWATHGRIYEQPSTNTVIALGARFIPEQALHIAIFAGAGKAALDFAKWKARFLGNDRLLCMFPEESIEIRKTLEENGFVMDDFCCIVMEK